MSKTILNKAIKDPMTFSQVKNGEAFKFLDSDTGDVYVVIRDGDVPRVVRIPDWLVVTPAGGRPVALVDLNIEWSDY